ncbi:hypothetical protein MJO28_008723, partial [Puccinia striiformis f. sp. tritici]
IICSNSLTIPLRCHLVYKLHADCLSTNVDLTTIAKIYITIIGNRIILIVTLVQVVEQGIILIQIIPTLVIILILSPLVLVTLVLIILIQMITVLLNLFKIQRLF